MGCNCPIGMFLDGERCVTPNKCPQSKFCSQSYAIFKYLDGVHKDAFKHFPAEKKTKQMVVIRIKCNGVIRDLMLAF